MGIDATQPERSMKSQRHTHLSAILYGGLIAGTLDIGAAALINMISPVVILKAIASGVLGKPAFAGGASVALLGLVLQWVMSLLIAAIFVFAARRLPRLVLHWPTWGVAYGVVVFFVMNYVVRPLSAAWPKTHFTPAGFVENMLAMLLFGLIVAYCARAFDTSSR
jgi:uncharacterized membrane protein YagU involved in acid resistance